LVESQAFLGFNICGQIFVVHIRNPIDGFQMKVHEEDFSRTIIVVKICYIEIAQTFIYELQQWFPEQEIMMALGIVYT